MALSTVPAPISSKDAIIVFVARGFSLRNCSNFCSVSERFISINGEAFFKHDHLCPFCHVPAEKTYEKQKKEYPEWLAGSFDQYESVFQCPRCGWWEYEYRNQSDAIIDGIRASDIEYSSAILRKYNDNAVNVPVAVLREYIQKKPEVICGIDAHKMEELVRSVFSDFYPSCTVKSFGKTRDGGKDGLLIDENNHNNWSCDAVLWQCRV